MFSFWGQNSQFSHLSLISTPPPLVFQKTKNHNYYLYDKDQNNQTALNKPNDPNEEEEQGGRHSSAL